MATLDIRLFGDLVLRQRAREVTSFDARLKRLADDMLDTMREAAGAGLAANQVGVLKRLFTWEVEDRHGAVVNPMLEDVSEELQQGDEGCLSFPGLFYPVERPLRVRVRHQDLVGDDHVTDAEGFRARVFLHELDHLNGVLFIDHLARHDRKEALKRMREYRFAQGLDDGVEASRSEAGWDGLLLGRREGQSLVQRSGSDQG